MTSLTVMVGPAYYCVGQTTVSTYAAVISRFALRSHLFTVVFCQTLFVFFLLNIVLFDLHFHGFKLPLTYIQTFLEQTQYRIYRHA